MKTCMRRAHVHVLCLQASSKGYCLIVFFCVCLPRLTGWVQKGAGWAFTPWTLTKPAHPRGPAAELGPGAGQGLVGESSSYGIIDHCQLAG